MYILLQDLKATPDIAPYLYCNTSEPVKYQWRQDFTSLNKIKVKHTAEAQGEEFITLRNMLTFYIKRDKAKFKVLARGKTLQRLFERYPEILL